MRGLQSQCAKQVFAVISATSREQKGGKCKYKAICLLSSAGKHGTLTSGFSSVISGDRAVPGAKQLQFSAGFSLHMHKGKSL